jgi:hypothetical protein
MTPYLFHGTSIYAMLEIASQNRVEGGQNDDFHHGVSLTRSLDLAGDFANTSDVIWRDHMGIGEDLPETTGAVLVFSRELLEQGHELTEVDFFDDETRDEQEERTNGSIEEASTYIVAIVVNPVDLETYAMMASQTDMLSDPTAVIASLKTSGLMISPEQASANFSEA